MDSAGMICFFTCQSVLLILYQRDEKEGLRGRMKQKGIKLLKTIILAGWVFSACTAPVNVVQDESVETLPQYKGKSGWMAFSAQVENTSPFEIFLLDLPSGRRIQITKNEITDISPSISRDGTWMVFSSEKNGVYNLYKTALPPEEPQPLAGLVADQTEPDISPDGTSIVFQTDAYGDFDIMTIDPSTLNQERLTKLDSQETQANWSPDGTQIAYLSDQDGDFEIFVMNSNGTGKTQLTQNDTYEASPVWSPDGEKIAFLSKRGLHFQIFTIDVSSGDEEQITDRQSTVHSPAWSPDGKQIAYIEENSNGSQINVLDIEKGITYLLENEFSKYAGLTWVDH
jgi:Tol biopolymer transport system component